MEDLEYIQPVVLQYEHKELALINKYSDDFQAFVNYFEGQELSNLVNLLFDLGRKKFKFAKTKLKYLAVYHSILNHVELLPADDIAEELLTKLDNVVGDAEAVSKIYDEIAESKKNDSVISKLNKEIIAGNKKNILRGNRDLKYKWYIITDRQEEAFEWLKATIVDNVEAQLKSLRETFGKDAEITFGVSDGKPTIAVDEEGDLIEDEEVYVKQTPQNPKEPLDLGRDPSIM